MSAKEGNKTVKLSSEDGKILTTSKITEQLKELTTKEAYFAALSEWVKHANVSQNAMTIFPWYVMSSYPQLFAQPAVTGNLMPTQNLAQPNAAASVTLNNLPAVVNGFSFRPLTDRAQAELINRHGGFEYIVAPFWKRAIAELIDMILVLFFKIITVFIIENVLGYQLDLSESAMIKALDDEGIFGFLLHYTNILAFSLDLLALEIAAKIFVCIYEAQCTAYFNGASVGKYIMGLSIKYVEAMVVLPNNNGIPAVPQPAFQIQLGFQRDIDQVRALLLPAETPSFKRAFVRAVVKNCIISTLVFTFFLMIFLKNNLTAYDILTKTAVVETASQPVLLRRPDQQQQ